MPGACLIGADDAHPRADECVGLQEADQLGVLTLDTALELLACMSTSLSSLHWTDHAVDAREQ